MKTRTIALAVVATLILALVATPPAVAQQGSFELSLGAGLTSLDDKLGGDTGGNLDFRAGYFVTDRLEIELQSAHASSILEGSFSAHTLNAAYHFEVEGDFMEWASGKKELVYYPEAEHCTVDYLDEVFPYIVDWLRRHLAAAEAGG